MRKLASMHSGAGNLFEQWREWLSLPPDILIEKILNPLPEASEMRQVSPFSGLLNSQQRALVLRRFREEYRA
ncbi:MAG: hypothetical protein GY815_16730 [Gammaproteobacteria bacterium]|nr:hypothetical protein [Gammaproteobacteria bacterium]